MKIKIGTITETIERLNNDIFTSVESGRERLSVELTDTTRSVAEINATISGQFKGTLTFIDDNGVEEAYTGYELESVRKSCDSVGKQIFVEFAKVKAV